MSTLRGKAGLARLPSRRVQVECGYSRSHHLRHVAHFKPRLRLHGEVVQFPQGGIQNPLLQRLVNRRVRALCVRAFAAALSLVNRLLRQRFYL